MKSPIIGKVWYRKTYDDFGNRINLHQKIVEDIIGKKLPKGAEIHHVDGDKHNNLPENLVVCPDRKYHHLLHARQRVLDAGYNPNLHKLCTDCKEYKLLADFYKNKSHWDGYANLCKICDNARRRVCGYKVASKKMDRC